MSLSQFEEEWDSLKKSGEHGTFDYSDSSASVRAIIKSHFDSSQRLKKYGVYVVRQQTTSEVLYVGKSGTIDRRGNFKGQDIPARMQNVKGEVTSSQWFKSLVKEKGPLVIEYVLLETVPKSPAFVEASLIQAYLNEHGCLPYRNKAF